MKLQTKIQLFSCIFLLILIVLTNTAIYFLYYKLSTDSELDQLAAHTDTIITELNKNTEVPEKELLKAYVPNDGMIRVIGKDSEPILGTLTKNEAYSKLNSAFETSEKRTINKKIAPEHVAVISKPIIWDDGEIVTLQVSKHLIVLKEHMHTLFFVLMIASLFILIPTIIGANVLSRFLLHPIKELTQAMRENMKQGHWKKIDVQASQSKDELYEMEMTFNDMIDELQETFMKQEVFVSDASHELKTPISIVKSYAQLLERRGLEKPELFTESVQAIDSEADRMQKLVEQMLQLAKNQQKTDFVEVDFTSICTEAVKTFQGAYTREIRYDGEEDVLVLGNPDQLKQIVYILIDNALKYSAESIDVSLEISNQSTVILRVTDHGEGIPVEDQKRIFDRFYRMDKARSRETGGTGLGLPIAKAISQAHHGDLSVTSQIGSGSTFTFQLPFMKEAT